MGINGLLPYLKPIQKDRNISHYRNQTVAIDSYCWLHKAIYSCALDIANNVQTELLLYHNIRPVMVFDGGALPSKKKTESERENAREQNRKKAIEFLNAGNTHMATRKFGESIDVTPQLAYNLYKVLQERYKIECIVAPYEADAQLAYLSKTGYVDLVISEDSDLLTFGVRKVFYKMDGSGNGKEIELDEIKTIRGDVPQDAWTHNLFLSGCILAGCDYLSSIRGIGFKKAYKLIGELKNYKSVIRQLKLEGKYVVPADYEDKFEKALLTFKFQRVFCPIKKHLVTLNELDLESIYNDKEAVLKNLAEDPSEVDKMIEINLITKILEVENLDFLGPDMSIELAQKIAYGQIDPVTKRPYLPENAPLSGEVSAWPMDKPASVQIKGTLGFTRPAILNESGQLEDEFSNSIPLVSPVFHNKAKHYKVAKPKLVGQKPGSQLMNSQQRNIKDFFRKNSDATEKIRNFFKRGNEGQEQKTSKGSDEEKLIPTEDPGSSQEMDSNFFNNQKKDEEKSEENFEEEKVVEERIERIVEHKTHADSFEERKGPPSLASLFKKQGSFSTEYDLYIAKNSQYASKNPNNLNKAFKVPSLVKKDPDSQGSVTPLIKEDHTSKRKAEEDIRTSFDQFAFKKIKKIEPLTLRKSENGFEARLGEPEPIVYNKPRVALDSIKGLEGFAFNTAKKTERKLDEECKKTVYKINLSTRLSNNSMSIDIQSLYNMGEEQEGEFKNFFKLNPINKLKLKDKLFARQGMEDYSNSRKFDMEGELNDKVSNFLMNFQ